MGLPDAVTARAADQHGLALRAELVREFSDDVVQGWVRHGLLERLHRGVLAVPGSPDTPHRRCLAAVWRCGEGAVVDWWWSGWLHGLERFDEPTAEGVVVPAPRRVRAPEFRVVSRVLEVVDCTVVVGVPALTATRALVEAAPHLTDKELRVAIDSARRKGLLSVRWLERCATKLRDVPGSQRGARRILALIGSRVMGQESEAEREMEAFLATTTLELEWGVTDLVPGRRLDAVDRAAGLVLECDSRAFHTLPTDRDNDGLRDLEIGARDLMVFHLTVGMVRYAPQETRRRLEEVRARRLAQRGAALG